MSMNNCPLGLTTAISGAAAAISKNLNDEELAFLGTVLVQLGDTLATILAHRVCEKKNEEILGAEDNGSNC